MHLIITYIISPSLPPSLGLVQQRRGEQRGPEKREKIESRRAREGERKGGREREEERGRARERWKDEKGWGGGGWERGWEGGRVAVWKGGRVEG